jgi:hypothetical protein
MKKLKNKKNKFNINYLVKILASNEGYSLFESIFSIIVISFILFYVWIKVIKPPSKNYISAKKLVIEQGPSVPKIIPKDFLKEMSKDLYLRGHITSWEINNETNNLYNMTFINGCYHFMTSVVPPLTQVGEKIEFKFSFKTWGDGQLGSFFEKDKFAELKTDGTPIEAVYCDDASFYPLNKPCDTGKFTLQNSVIGKRLLISMCFSTNNLKENASVSAKIISP